MTPAKSYGAKSEETSPIHLCFIVLFCFLGTNNYTKMILLVLETNVVRKSYKKENKFVEFHVERILFIYVFKNIKLNNLCTIFYGLHSFMKTYFKENNLRIAHKKTYYADIYEILLSLVYFFCRSTFVSHGHNNPVIETNLIFMYPSQVI